MLLKCANGPGRVVIEHLHQVGHAKRLEEITEEHSVIVRRFGPGSPIPSRRTAGSRVKTSECGPPPHARPCRLPQAEKLRPRPGRTHSTTTRAAIGGDEGNQRAGIVRIPRRAPPGTPKHEVARWRGTGVGNDCGQPAVDDALAICVQQWIGMAWHDRGSSVALGADHLEHTLAVDEAGHENDVRASACRICASRNVSGP